MQNRTQLWKNLMDSGIARLETIAQINGVTCSAISDPKIDRALFSDSLSIGNCVSASLQMSIMTDTEVPKSAEIKIQSRLTDDMNYSEWIDQGTFYISKRQKDPVTGLLNVTCYDSMLKANNAFPVKESDVWPMPMDDVVIRIAETIGVEIDDRTWKYLETGYEYVVEDPTVYSMTRVLSNIGSANGGNWIISPENKLRFVPLVQVQAETVSVLGVLEKINVGTTLTVSGVRFVSTTTDISAGDSSGYVITVSNNPYITQGICDRLLEKLGGMKYQSYELSKAVYDPCAELGDIVVSKDDVHSILASEKATLGLSFRGSISAPHNAEVDDEYPRKSAQETVEDLDDKIKGLVTVVADKANIESLNAVVAMIESLSVSDIKTGIIHSDDYSVEQIEFVYPAEDLYPEAQLYPTNGEIVLKGFAIDFASGTVYGAFYSDQISELSENFEEQKTTLAELQKSVEEYMNGVNKILDTITGQISNIADQIQEMNESLIYPKA